MIIERIYSIMFSKSKDIEWYFFTCNIGILESINKFYVYRIDGSKDYIPNSKYITAIVPKDKTEFKSIKKQLKHEIYPSNILEMIGCGRIDK